MFTRIWLIVLILGLAFGAGVVLRGSGDDRSAEAAGAAPRVEGEGRFRPIRLVRADPGVLRRPTPEPSPSPAAPAAAAPAVSAPAAPPASPAPEPDPAPTEPPVQPDGDGSDGANDPPTSSFDLDG
jgi:hypothetical protein